MIGKTILHYEILEQIGEGGMGTVYKAKDTKLDRFVALKFLPSQLATTEDEKARFIQEAKAASAINHPNICTIYDIQEDEGKLFIVMEYIDGVTLREKKENLSEKRILDIGVQAAEGLAAAHEKGIVHRDIKPENIMIRKDGIVQIMDFGLAKLYTDSNVSRLTKAGTTMGTMGYMSPEQVQGLDVDHRSDIFSLGVVMYELFAGESPFKGMHETAIMYEIVNVEAPPIATVKADIDPQLDGLILECLEKDKDERCQSAKELAKNLRKIKRVSTGNKTSRMYNVNSTAYQTTTSQPVTSKSSGSIAIEIFNKRFDLQNIFSLKLIPWVIVFFLAITLLYVLNSSNNSDSNKLTTQTSIIPPPETQYVGGDGAGYELSKDGTKIVFVARDSLGTEKLWVRSLKSLQANVLKGTDGAWYPFWSPDGKQIAYFTNGSLMKIDINSGSPLKICDAIAGRGGSWNRSNIIVFAPAAMGGLYKVSANGGEPLLLVKVDTSNADQSLRFPYFLPDGEHFIYSIQNSFYSGSPTDEIKVASVNGDLNKSLFNTASNAQYADGRIFFIRQSILMSLDFDPDNFKVGDDVQTITGNLNYFEPRIKGAFSVSDKGSLIFQHKNTENRKLVLLDRRGHILENIQDIAIEFFAKFSPDDKQISYGVLDKEGKNADIWIYDLKRKISSRVTFNLNYDVTPVFSPDGKKVVYASNPDKIMNLFVKNIDGSGDAELIYESNFIKIPTDWSKDGKYIVYSTFSSDTKWDVKIIDLGDNNKVINFINTKFSELGATFSPDSKWICYTSDETGKPQSYVKPFNNGVGKWQISIDGAIESFWAKDGKSIFYSSRDRKFYNVKINISDTKFVVGTPQLIFSYTNKTINYIYDVTIDGKTFLAELTKGKAKISPITYIHNWQGLINKSN